MLLLTDGEIWNQEPLFKYINQAVDAAPIRFFSLGIGNTASHSLIQGIARAGKGFAQAVTTGEELNKKVVRMLKGALTPHIDDYTMEVEYDNDTSDEHDDFEMMENTDVGAVIEEKVPSQQQPISLFDENFKETDITKIELSLPEIPSPPVLQAPYKISGLYPFSRTTVYLLLSSERTGDPKSLTFKGTSKAGPLVLQIPIEDAGEGTTIHQIAARKITLDLEEGRGWIFHAKDNQGQKFVQKYPSKAENLVKREAVRLGTKYQIANRWCSFVAIESSSHDLADRAKSEGKVLPQPRTVPSGSGYSGSASAALPSSPYSLPAMRRSAGIRTRGAPTLLISACSTRGPAEPASDKLRQGAGRAGISGGSAFAERRRCHRSPALSASLGGSGGSQRYCDTAAVACAAAAPEPDYRKLISLQTFEGTWPWQEEVFEILNVTDGMLMKLLDWSKVLGTHQEIDQDDETMRTLFITLAVVAHLNQRCADSRDTWELVAEKAMDWANAQIKTKKVNGRVLSQEMTVYLLAPLI